MKFILENVIFFDMDKIRADAQTKFGGSIKKLLQSYDLDKYYAINKDNIDFKSGALISKKSKLNQFIIDYSGEFKTDKIASRIIPDENGTEAPIKIKGELGTRPYPNPAPKKAPTTPVKTAPPKPQGLNDAEFTKDLKFKVLGDIEVELVFNKKMFDKDPSKVPYTVFLSNDLNGVLPAKEEDRTVYIKKPKNYELELKPQVLKIIKNSKLWVDGYTETLYGKKFYLSLNRFNELDVIFKSDKIPFELKVPKGKIAKHKEIIKELIEYDMPRTVGIQTIYTLIVKDPMQNGKDVGLTANYVSGSITKDTIKYKVTNPQLKYDSTIEVPVTKSPLDFLIDYVQKEFIKTRTPKGLQVGENFKFKLLGKEIKCTITNTMGNVMPNTMEIELDYGHTKDTHFTPKRDKLSEVEKDTIEELSDGDTYLPTIFPNYKRNVKFDILNNMVGLEFDQKSFKTDPNTIKYRVYVGMPLVEDTSYKVKNFDNLESDLSPLVIDDLKSKGYWHDGDTFVYFGHTLRVEPHSYFATNLKFNITGSFGSLNCAIPANKLKDFASKVYDTIELNLSDVIDSADTLFSFALKNPATKKDEHFSAKYKFGSLKKDSITYTIECKNLKFVKEVTLFDKYVPDIETELKHIAEQGMMNILISRGDIVSDKKRDILRTKGNPKKEKVLREISKYMHRKSFRGVKNLTVGATDVDIVDSNFVGIDVLFIDLEGMGDTSVKQYYTYFGNITLKSTVQRLKLQYKELDRGIDASGNAYIKIKITDENYMKDLIKEFKLNEVFNIANTKNLSKLFESVQRRS